MQQHNEADGSHLKIIVTPAAEGLSCEMVLTSPDGELKARFPLRAPTLDTDAEELRWILEDFPSLAGPTTNDIGARVDRRLQTLAADLRRTFFEESQNMSAITAALADDDVRRLRVTIDDQSAAWLPWELLPGPGSAHPLATRAHAFTRTVPQGTRENPDRAPGPLRVLIVVSRPAGLDDVPFRSVASRLARTAMSENSRIVLTALRPPTWEKLQQALAEAASAGRPYDVVHFDGHGVYRPDFFVPSRKRGYVRIESTSGDVVEISGVAMGSVLAQYGVRFALLNACRSAYTEEDPNAEATSFASDLIAEGLESALAMAFNVHVATAARIFDRVYASLAEGQPLERAATLAREQELRRAGSPRVQPWSWLIPVVMTGPGEPVDHPAARESQASPLERLHRVTGGTVAPLDSPAFVGYDNEFLLLDRALSGGGTAEVTGVRGAGKSRLSVEFAKWSVTTGLADHAIVATFTPSSNVTDVLAAIRETYAFAGTVLLVLDGADLFPSDPSIEAFLAECAARHDLVLRAGRRSTSGDDVTTVVLNGLDLRSSISLAAELGWNAGVVPGALAWLDWAHGIPSALALLPALTAGLEGDDLNGSYRKLMQVRSGLLDEATKELVLREAALEEIELATLTSAAPPLALALFHGRIDALDWEIFRQTLAAKGAEALAEDFTDFLESASDTAERSGLVSKQPDGGLGLHPLAGVAAGGAFFDVVNAASQGDDEAMRQHLAVYLGSFVVTVCTRIRTDQAMPGRRVPVNTLDNGENLIQAIELSMDTGWWTHVFILLKAQRNRLLARQRHDEWSNLLERASVAYQASEPEPDPSDWEETASRYFDLMSEEASRLGDHDASRTLRDGADRFRTVPARAADEPDDAGTDVHHIIVNKRYSEHMRRGRRLQNEGSPECLDAFRQALDVIADDIIRTPIVLLSMGKAYFHVPALRDLDKAESYARKALEEASKRRHFFQDIMFDSMNLLALAVWESVYDKRFSAAEARQRVLEAKRLFERIASAETAPRWNRATAHNNLGNISLSLRIGDHGVEEYLQACAMYEELHDWDRLAYARTNAVRALIQADRIEDGRALASTVKQLRGLASDEVMERVTDQLIEDGLWTS